MRNERGSLLSKGRKGRAGRKARSTALERYMYGRKAAVIPSIPVMQEASNEISLPYPRPDDEGEDKANVTRVAATMSALGNLGGSGSNDWKCLGRGARRSGDRVARLFALSAAGGWDARWVPWVPAALV